MSNRAYAFMTGLFILVLSAALAGAALWLGGYQVERSPYVVVAHDPVNGLNAQSTIYYRGISAGVVDSIEIDPDDIRNILITIEVNKNIPITQGTFATLKSRGVTGLSYIQLNDKGNTQQPLKTSNHHPARIPMHKSLFAEFEAQGRDILSEVKTTTQRVNKLLSEENLTRLNHLLASAQTSVEHLNRLEERAQESLEGVPRLTRHAESTLDNIDTLTGNLNRTSTRVHQTAQRIGKLTGKGQRITDALQTHTLPRLNKLLLDLQGTSRNVRALSHSLEQDPQSLLRGKQPPAPGPGEPGFSGYPGRKGER